MNLPPEATVVDTIVHDLGKGSWFASVQYRTPRMQEDGYLSRTFGADEGGEVAAREWLAKKLATPRSPAR